MIDFPQEPIGTEIALTGPSRAKKKVGEMSHKIENINAYHYTTNEHIP